MRPTESAPKVYYEHIDLYMIKEANKDSTAIALAKSEI